MTLQAWIPVSFRSALLIHSRIKWFKAGAFPSDSPLAEAAVSFVDYKTQTESEFANDSSPDHNLQSRLKTALRRID